MNPSGVVTQETETDTESRRAVQSWAPRLAWALAAVTGALALAALALLYSTRSTPTPPAWGFRGYSAILAFAFAAVGTLVAARRPRNTIGWLLSAAGMHSGIQGLAYEYAVFALLARPGSLPGGETAAWVNEWWWVLAVGGIGGMSLLLFPDGRFLSPRWRPVSWLIVASVCLFALSIAVSPGPFRQLPPFENPFGLKALSGSADSAMLGMAALTTVTAIVISMLSLVLRFRRTQSGAERQQMKWFAYIGVLFAGSVAANQTEIILRGSSSAAMTDVLVVLAGVAIPASIGIAVLRYRLYDIDFVINKTLVYLPLTAILAGLYMAFVGLFKTLMTQLTGQTSDAGVALTTLSVVALSTPMKNALQGLVDKYFKEAPDPARDLRKLEGQVRQVVEVMDQGQIGRRFLAEATRALQAEAGAIYLWEDGRKRLLCA
ncbi:MAG: hypothetical protein HY681_10215, partial [Chloroflexi bacterium]|nr:hypothetical protein [Chloroflexota bacterium]